MERNKKILPIFVLLECSKVTCQYKILCTQIPAQNQWNIYEKNETKNKKICKLQC